jgi:hypothetical protein
MKLSQSQHKVVLLETTAATLFNAIVPTAIIWLIGALPPKSLTDDQPLFGLMGGAAGMATLGMTLVISFMVAGRIRRGEVLAVDSNAAAAAILLLPQNVLLRAIFMGLLAIIVFVPIGLLLGAQLKIVPMTEFDFVVFNTIYGALVGIVMAPIAAVRALIAPR